MPKQLNNGKITEALQKAFGFKGRYNPMLDEVIVPVYTISDPIPAAPFNVYAASMLIPPAPTLANAPVANFTNPSGSGVLAQITSVSAGSFVDSGPQPDNVVLIELFLSQQEYGDVTGTIRKRDSRVPVDAKARITGGERVPAGGSFVFARALIKTDSVTAQLEGGVGGVPRQGLITMEPNSGFDMQLNGTEAVNPGDAPLLVNYTWIEVPLSGSVTNGAGTP